MCQTGLPIDITGQLDQFKLQMFDTRSSDLFDLGLLLFETITGSKPFTMFKCDQTNQVKIVQDSALYKLAESN